MSGLEDIRCRNALPLLSSPSSSHGSAASSSDSDDTSMVDGCWAYRLVGGKETYGSLEGVAGDIRPLGVQQNNCLDEIVSLKGEIKLLKAVITRLEGDTVAHETELTIGRGEPVWGSRDKIHELVHAEAAKCINGDVTLSPPPSNIRVAFSSGSRKVCFDESSNAGFVEVGKKFSRGCKANRRRRDRVTDPTAVTAHVPVPVAVPVSSTPTGAAMYSRVAATPPPPAGPHMTRPG